MKEVFQVIKRILKKQEASSITEQDPLFLNWVQSKERAMNF